MSSIKDTIFGGTDNSAQINQRKENDKTQEFLEQQQQLARDDVNKYMPQGIKNQRDAMMSAMDVLRGSTPMQADIVNQGSEAAQNSIIQGMVGARDAVMGIPTQLMPEIVKFNPQTGKNELAASPFAGVNESIEQAIPEFLKSPQNVAPGGVMDAAGNMNQKTKEQMDNFLRYMLGGGGGGGTGTGLPPKAH